MPHVLFFLLFGAFLGSAAHASPLPPVSTSPSADMIVQAGLKCDFINGKLVCGKKKSKEHHDDDDDDDDDHHGKGKKKGDAAELTNCTIQQPGSGGGCKSGLKWVCQKMKSGKKCCGCVPDPNAKTENKPPVQPEQAPAQTQQATQYCCVIGSATYKYCAATENEAYLRAQGTQIGQLQPKPISCAKQ